MGAARRGGLEQLSEMGCAALGVWNSGLGRGNVPAGLLLGRAGDLGKGEKTTRTTEVNVRAAVKKGKEG